MNTIFFSRQTIIWYSAAGFECLMTSLNAFFKSLRVNQQIYWCHWECTNLNYNRRKSCHINLCLSKQVVFIGGKEKSTVPDMNINNKLHFNRPTQYPTYNNMGHVTGPAIGKHMGTTLHFVTKKFKNKC